MTAHETTAVNKRIFFVSYLSGDGHVTGCYSVTVDENMTRDLVWASEKCRFTPGSTVRITDTSGKSKTFIKEK